MGHDPYDRWEHISVVIRYVERHEGGQYTAYRTKNRAGHEIWPPITYLQSLGYKLVTVYQQDTRNIAVFRRAYGMADPPDAEGIEDNLPGDYFQEGG